MEIKERLEETPKTPEIYAAISLSFGPSVDVGAIVNDLNKIGIYEIKVQRPKIDASLCVDIAIIHNEQFWELDDALTKMFLKVDQCLYELKRISTEYCGEIYIDIAFYQYGIYPTLVIHRNNMKKIHILEANLSIDPL